MPVPVVVSEAPPEQAWTNILTYSGANAEYVGIALALQPSYAAVVVSSVTKGSPTTFNATAHGMATGNRIRVAGATGDWAALNGYHVISVVNANSFTIAVDSTAYAGSFDGAVSTRAPRTCDSVWAIRRNFFDVDGNTIRTAWAEGLVVPQYKFDDRATLAYH